MFSTKKLWKVTILWLGMENEFWFEKRRLHVIASLHYAVLFLFQIHLLILLPNSCIVASRMGLVFSLGTPIETPTAIDWAYVQEVLSVSRTVFLDSKLFSVPLHLFIKWSRGGAREVDSPIRLYRYVFKTISWNIEIQLELFFSYKSLVTSSDV